jgi:hypothetical protein
MNVIQIGQNQSPELHSPTLSMASLFETKLTTNKAKIEVIATLKNHWNRDLAVFSHPSI